MAYSRTSNGTFDIKGVFNDQWISTTYVDVGYYTYVKAGSDATLVDANTFEDATALDNGLKIGINFDFLNDGQLLQVKYTVQNTNKEAVTYALGSGSDVKIGTDDAAVISNFEGLQGFKMVSGDDYYTKGDGTEDYAQFNFFGDKAFEGVSDDGVSNYWYGTYDKDDYDYYWDFNEKIAIFDYGKAESSSTSKDGKSMDSAATWHWDNQTLAAGETHTHCLHWYWWCGK